MSIRPILAAALAIAFGTDVARADEPPCGARYYLTLFGTQSVPYELRFTHTWAVFTRTTYSPGGDTRIESHTISWMPATLRIRPLALRTETGVNLSLDQSFAFAASFAGRMSVWGPYEIDADHFANLMVRKQRLESGEILYRAIGAFSRQGAVSNCGQSFSRAAPTVGRRYLQPTPSAGENGTSHLALRYLQAGLLGDSGKVHDWLLPSIIGHRYPATSRQPAERTSYFHR